MCGDCTAVLITVKRPLYRSWAVCTFDSGNAVGHVTREESYSSISILNFLLLDFDEDNLILISTCSKRQLLLHVKAISMLKKLLHKSDEVFLENI